MRFLFAALPALLLAGCSGGIVPPAAGPAPVHRPPTRGPAAPSGTDAVARPVPATPIAPAPATPAAGAATAAAAGLTAGPAIASLRIGDAEAARALAAFRVSCPALLRRTDASGLASGEAWRPVCDAARDNAPGDARAFFERRFEAVQIGDGRAFATGYYEPEIAGSRRRAPGYDVPVYGLPDDLIEVDLGRFADNLRGRRVKGRVEGRALVPYHDRAAIEGGALAGRNLEIAWAADPVEMFFLEVQGSGRLRLPDGSVMRIGYAGQNGRDYTGIGALMRERGLLAPGQANMQGIIAWLSANPEQGRAIMRENRSFVFFRELTGPGPLGALGLPVSPDRKSVV